VPVRTNPRAQSGLTKSRPITQVMICGLFPFAKSIPKIVYDATPKSRASFTTYHDTSGTGSGGGE
jgi:hypothetical protein